MNKVTNSTLFFNIVCNYNPYFSSLMNVDIPKLPDYSPENISDIINQMSHLINSIEDNGSCDEEDTYLLKSIQTMKLFIENPYFWNNPIYYYSRLQQNIEVCWNNYEAIRSGIIKKEVLKSRIKEIPCYIDTIINNMENAELGKIDCIYGMIKFKSIKTELLSYVTNKVDIQKDISLIEDKLDKLCIFLERKNEECKLLLKRNNPEALHNYLISETGLRVSPEQIGNSLWNSLELRKLPKTNLLNYHINYFPNDINEITEKLIIIGDDLFGNICELQGTIEFKHLCKAENSVLNYIGYLPNSVNKDICHGYFLYNDKYMDRNEYDKILGFVHEIYPGHHYANCINRKINKGKISKILYESTAFTEGWAKYCEFLYAYRLLSGVQFKKSFDEQLYRINIIGIIAYELHYNGKTYNDVKKILKNIYPETKQKEIQSIILQAYMYPVESISNIIGFLYFYNHFGLNVTKDSIRMIMKEGAWLLQDSNLSVITK